MIYHNAKNGFPSSILNERYNADMIHIYTTEDHKVRKQQITSEVRVTHDIFGSTLSIRTEDEIYVIPMDKIISDILEVEHENETLYTDR